ncbi:MAG TPA: HAMP domain-containing histidine kinase [Caldithrix sp.]|nr:HAMP domain-containing histidine kinase [Caldithrix sp.]
MRKLNENLISLNQRLVNAEQIKSNFISNISNEILNPFTSILGLSKNILEVKKEDWKKVITMVAMIHSEAFNLDFQLKNIFAAARIEAGEVLPEISNIDIKGLILDIIDSFKYEAHKKTIRLQYKFSTTDKNRQYYFQCDSEKIRLILSNLLSNAIKFSKDKGAIIINTRIKNDEMICSVQDFGEGISRENQQIIYNRFNRSDSGIETTFRGHGLGLSINKAMIEILHGKIEFKTSTGNGTKFTVSLPKLEGESEGITLDGNELLF